MKLKSAILLSFLSHKYRFKEGEFPVFFFGKNFSSCPSASRGEWNFSESLTVRGEKKNKKKTYFAPLFHSSTVFSNPAVVNKKIADDVKTAAKKFHVQSIKPVL